MGRRRSEPTRPKGVLLARAAVLLLLASRGRIEAFSAKSATSSVAASRTEWQDELLRHSHPLQPTPLAQALDTLKRDGVVRIASSDCGGATAADAESCQALRSCILDAILSTRDGMAEMSDKRFVPGTRLRFTEPVDLAFGGDSRHDLLLPLECQENTPALKPVLYSAASQLEPLLRGAAKTLLPRLVNIHNNNSPPPNDNSEQQALELVEIGSLVVRPGSNHQEFHADYRKYHREVNDEELREHTEARIGKVPPRLVSFVALQDVPTNEHGVTAFVTGTHNAHAHEFVYGTGQGVDTDYTTDVARVLENRDYVLQSSTNGVVTTQGMQTGDMLVYDASVLHWGSANRVTDFDRAILYFGVSLPGAAQMCSEPTQEERTVDMGYDRQPPVWLEDALAVLQ